VGYRQRIVWANIDKSGQGVEIGAAHNPTVSLADGFNVEVIDHADQSELIDKYQGHDNVAANKIGKVDYIWHGESYAELTGKPGHYSWVVASHVIEHTPDLIGFLNECDSLLNEHGTLVLVIPDKRYCFDVFRPLTGIGGIVDAHVSGRTIHTPGTALEAVLNSVFLNGAVSWEAGASGQHSLHASSEKAVAAFKQSKESSDYVDHHAWCFVPASFRLLIHDLNLLGFTGLRERAYYATHGCEFIVVLERGAVDPQLDRLQLAQAVLDEAAARPTLGERLRLGIKTLFRPVRRWRRALKGRH